MVRFLPKTRNLKKVGFWGPDQESAKVSKKFSVDFDKVVGDDPSWWAGSLGSLLKGKAALRRYFSKEYHKGEAKKAFLCLTFVKITFGIPRWSLFVPYGAKVCTFMGIESEETEEMLWKYKSNVPQ